MQITMIGDASKENCDGAIAKISCTGKQVTEFKTPSIPPLRKKKKKVLDEETYVHQLGKIIERDFFPDLENLKDKVAYLEARECNDVERLQYLYSKYSTGGRLSTPASVIDSPATFDTPDIRTRKRKKLDKSPLVDGVASGNAEANDDDTVSSSEAKKLSLDEFLARHTSEDDDSFESSMEDAKQLYMMKKAWMFEAENLHNAIHAPDLTMMALPANDTEARALLKEDLSKPLTLENWKFKTFNSIMYVPDAHHPSRASDMALAAAAPREVVHGNTRFMTNPFVKPMNQATVMEASAVQAIMKEGRIGVDGRELSKETPHIRGYTFVGDASPAPGVEESPLITWGEVEGTPFQLDRCSTPLVHSVKGSAPSYSIPKVPYRDLVALQLNEKANQAQRDKKSKAVSAARSNLCTPGGGGGSSSRRSSSSDGGRWATERLANISPAARRLLSSGRLGVRQNTDHTLRASYTPTPPAFTPSPSSARLLSKSLRSSAYAKFTPSPAANKAAGSARKGGASSLRSPSGRTPSWGEKRKEGSSVVEAPSLTDGLLQLPKMGAGSATGKKSSFGRRCAADFF